MIADAVRRLLAATSAAFLLVILHGAWSAATAEWLRAGLAALVIVAAASPLNGLLVLAGLGPIVSLTGGAAHAPLPLLELSVLCCLAGWSMRFAVAPRVAWPPGLAAPVACLAAIVIASAIVELGGKREALGAAALLERVITVITQDFVVDHRSLPSLSAAVAVLENLGVFAVAATVVFQRPERFGRLIRMASIGACAAAALNLQRVLVVAVASPHPLERLYELARTLRVNVHYSDVNAAGSYFALMFFPAAALAVRAAGAVRLGWSLGAAAIFAAAWLSGSRAAIIAILIVSAATILLNRRSRQHRWTVPIAITGCLIAAVLFVMLFSNQVIGPGTWLAAQVRIEMGRVTLGMLQRHPWFGVGIGRYYASSAPLLAQSSIAQLYVRENAHNNFLQFLGELGIVGFAILLWVVFRSASSLKDATSHSDDGRIRGVAAGLAAFGLTAMVGHPLLTPDVALAFWMIAGAAAGTGAPGPNRVMPQRARYALWAFAALLVISLPLRINNEIRALDLRNVQYGFSRAGSEADGTRYQAVTDAATVFLPADTATIRIPVRKAGGTAPAELEISLDGRLIDKVVVTDDWRELRFATGRKPARGQYYKLGLAVRDGKQPPVEEGEIRVGKVETVSRPQ